MTEQSQNVPKRACVTNAFSLSSMTTILPRTPNMVHNSIRGKNPLTIKDSVARHQLPNQVDSYCIFPPQILLKEFVTIEFMEGITTLAKLLLPPVTMHVEPSLLLENIWLIFCCNN